MLHHHLEHQDCLIDSEAPEFRQWAQGPHAQPWNAEDAYRLLQRLAHTPRALGKGEALWPTQVVNPVAWVAVERRGEHRIRNIAGGDEGDRPRVGCWNEGRPKALDRRPHHPD